eukprot:TRINITY_DN50350_c0_g1_i1.p3 TRINITY_DN50350_c0_g1~~TRINITY_DN50350_c0_g1_i1.p3  ORF type:complete len:138 (-),score=30.09 TRINITY_DN50350_c0_g1_i1:235-648(-)
MLRKKQCYRLRGGMSENVSVDKKVEQLRPGDDNVNITVKVVEQKAIQDKGPAKFSESIVGDETGVILMRARNQQVEMMKKGAVLKLEQARVEIQKGMIKLAVVPPHGQMEEVEGAKLKVNDDFNMSEIQFEMVIVEQ